MPTTIYRPIRPLRNAGGRVIALQEMRDDEVIGLQNGGLGFNHIVEGAIVAASAADTLDALLPGVDGQVLTMVAGLPAWAAVATPVIDPTHGGTGLVAYDPGDILYASAPNVLATLPATTDGFVLTLVAGFPAWVALPTPITDEAHGGTGQSTYATGDILYASAVNTLAKLAAGTNGYVLTMVAGVPAWAVGGGDNVSTTSVFFNVDSDNNDGTDADNFDFGKDRLAGTGGSLLMRLNASGYLLLGHTVTSSVGAFELVLKNACYIRAVNAAGTDTKGVIGIDSSNTVLLGGVGGGVNVRVTGGVLLINTTVTTGASSGDIVCAFQRGLRILNSSSSTAYYAIDRTTVGGSQVIRIDPSVIGPVGIGNPGYVDDAAAGDLVLQNNNGLWATNAAGSHTLLLIKLLAANTIQIGTTTHVGIGGAPATSGALDVQSTTGAIIAPRMTTAQKNALTAVNGMVVFDTDLVKLQGYEGAWTNII